MSERTQNEQFWSQSGHMMVLLASQISLLEEKRSQGGQGCLRATCRDEWGVYMAFPRALPHLAGTENSSPSCDGCQPSQGSENEQVGVPAQPGKVQGHLLSKIAPRRKGEVGVAARKDIRFWESLENPHGGTISVFMV